MANSITDKTPHPDDVETFVEYLRRAARGRTEARTAREINAALGFRDRYLRALAHSANAAGILVCADNSGYFVPIDSAEVAQTIGRLRSQAFEMLSRATLLERLAGVSFRKPKPARAPDLFDGVPADGGAVVVPETDFVSQPGRRSRDDTN